MGSALHNAARSRHHGGPHFPSRMVAVLSTIGLLMGLYVAWRLFWPLRMPIWMKVVLSLLLVGVAVTGPAVGGVMPLWAAISASRFGTGSLGFVMGCTASLMMPINLLGLHTIGTAFDLTGSYNAAFELFLAGLGLAALAMLAVSSTRHADLQKA